MHRVLALSCLMLATLSVAESPDSEAGATAAKETVEKVLINPLVKRESSRSRFTRAPIMPAARRIRILDREPKTDEKGEQFHAFAVDSKWDAELDEKVDWQQDTLVGCVYPSTGKVFVKSGGAFFPSGRWLGKREKAAPPTVCTSVQLSRR